jgi:hypothetical protein
MAFPKISLMQNLKDLVTKGPQGLVNERMKEHLASADQMMKLDRSDPEAMRRYMAQQNAEIEDRLGGHFGKNLISPGNRAGIERIQNEALENQAALYKMLGDHKAAQPANDGRQGEPLVSPKNPDIDK